MIPDDLKRLVDNLCSGYEIELLEFSYNSCKFDYKFYQYKSNVEFSIIFYFDDDHNYIYSHISFYSGVLLSLAHYRTVGDFFEKLVQAFKKFY